jgi:hypothetical protein
LLRLVDGGADRARGRDVTRMASNRPIRWLLPPPQRTAYFWARRRPGKVLRVSSTVAPVPAMAST